MGWPGTQGRDGDVPPCDGYDLPIQPLHRRGGRCPVEGAGTIGGARTALLNHADEVDRGELSVSDMWVVLIKPARVSAEKAASLQAQAKAEQAEINRLLVALGDADSGTAAQVQAAAKNFGFALPGPNDPRNLDPNSGFAQPADQVPNPMTLNGLIQQGVVRDNDMAQTVRESKEWVTEDGQVRKTLTMMDGSRHEIYEWNEFLPCVEDTYYDKNGKEVSSTFSQDKTNYDGTEVTMTPDRGRQVHRRRDGRGWPPRCAAG